MIILSSQQTSVICSLFLFTFILKFESMKRVVPALILIGLLGFSPVRVIYANPIPPPASMQKPKPPPKPKGPKKPKPPPEPGKPKKPSGPGKPKPPPRPHLP